MTMMLTESHIKATCGRIQTLFSTLACCVEGKKIFVALKVIIHYTIFRATVWWEPFTALIGWRFLIGSH